MKTPDERGDETGANASDVVKHRDVLGHETLVDVALDTPLHGAQKGSRAAFIGSLRETQKRADGEKPSYFSSSSSRSL